MTVAIGSLRVLLYRGRLESGRIPRKKIVRAKPRALINRVLTRLADRKLGVSAGFLSAFLCCIPAGLSGPVFAQGSRPLDNRIGGAKAQIERVHYGDVIDVDVVGGFEFDWRGTITPEGHLDGLHTFDAPIYALCRSESEIAADITRDFSTVLRDPKVIVRIIDRSNRALVLVDGAVRTPTRFGIRRKTTLREILILSGGLINGASGEITIFRPANSSCSGRGETPSSQDNRPQTMNITISDLLSGKVNSDPVIVAGDVVTVSRALPVYVIGAVQNPGPVYLTSEMSLSRAISTAGGMTKDADGDKVTIFRRSTISAVPKVVDLGKISRGEMEDEVLRSFDIIDVPAKGGDGRKYPPSSPQAGVRDVPWAQMPLKIVD